jgi:hypothetical protein
MTLVLTPNLEALVAKWLREHPDLMGLGVRVGPRIPESTTGPWVRVTLLDLPDDPVSGVEYLLDGMLQLDCYAGSTAAKNQTQQAEAYAVAATSRAVLRAMQGSTSDGVVVTRVRFNGHARIPDTDMEPARERYILTAEIMVHRA